MPSTPVSCLHCERPTSQGYFCSDICRYFLMHQSLATSASATTNGYGISLSPSPSTVVKEPTRGRPISRKGLSSNTLEWCKTSEESPLRDMSKECGSTLKDYENSFDQLRLMKRNSLQWIIVSKFFNKSCRYWYITPNYKQASLRQ